MRALVGHPVPVRWRPPRSGTDRIDFQVARTEVEIPEAATAELGEERSYVLAPDDAPSRYHVFEGRAYELVTAGAFGDGSPRRHRPAPIDLVLSALADRSDMPAHPFEGLTPLTGGPHPHPSGAGEDLAPHVLAASAADNTAAAREALRAYAARSLLLVDGRELFLRRGLPVLAPTLAPPYLPRPPRSLDGGPVFEPSRYILLTRFRESARVPDTVSKLIMPWHSRFHAEPYQDDDLDLWIQDGPRAVERLRDALARRRPDAAGALLGTEPLIAPLLPYADLGRIGAVPASERHVVSDLMGRALAGIRAAIPDGYDPPRLRWMLAYHERVGHRAFPAPAPPDEDLDALSGMAPGFGGSP